MAKKEISRKTQWTREENAQREMFCFLYASGKSMDHFGNATKSYSTAYDYDSEIQKLEEELMVIPYSKEAERKEKRRAILMFNNTCRSGGSRMLTIDNIIAKCDNYLNKLFDAEHMDNELAWASTQRKDIASKVAAIREFNRVKNRVEERVINNNTIYTWATDKDLSKGSKIQKEEKKKI